MGCRFYSKSFSNKLSIVDVIMSIEQEQGETSFWDHTKELLLRLRTIIYSIIIGTLVAMLLPVSLEFTNFSAENPLYPTITSSLIINLQERFLPGEAILLPLDFLAPLEIYFFVAIIVGIIISIPVISYELYKFINPALHEHEKSGITWFTISFSSLFMFGLILGYLIIIPVSMQTVSFFANLLNLPPTYAFNAFFSLVGFALLASGLIFTLPLFLVLLVKAGLLKTKSFSGNRRYLYGLLIIIIAILDPDPSLVTETVVFLPLVLLTEVSILFAKRIERAREKSENTVPTPE
jgi:sec-independent protein translocase protein TatC